MLKLILINILLFCVNYSNTFDRDKRYIIFPPAAPTRHQLISGVGIPLQTEEAIIVGWVWKGQYFLPINATDLRPAALYLRRKRENSLLNIDKPKEKTVKKFYDNTTNIQVETYQQDAIEIEMKKIPDNTIDDDEDDDYPSWMDEDENEFLGAQTDSKFHQPTTPVGNNYNLDSARWTAYKSLEAIAERNGFNGKVCVLKSICETAETPFAHENGILGELLHIVLTPSSTKEPIDTHTDNEYLKAEELGKSGASCSQIFKECKKSILDIISGVVDSFADLEQFLNKRKK